MQESKSNVQAIPANPPSPHTVPVDSYREEHQANGNRKVTKKRATGHVDGLVALLMAIGVANLPDKEKAKEYQMIFV